MQSRLLVLPLLAALLAARMRLGSAEGDPLPQSLIDLVWDSPISSVEDLKLLLQQEASEIEDKEDEHDGLLNPSHGRYIRSLETQQAQKAECKVRTEVMEITRSHPNFIMWPPCVEVQRCSGCCNSRQLQCVPTVTSTRHLQVTKIVFINRIARYEKAIIPVEDHVSCLCRPSTSFKLSSTSSTVLVSQPNPLPPPQQRPPTSSHLPLFPPRTPHPLPPKTHTSKADLHRHDDLKHNQQHEHSHQQDPLARQWQQGSYTQLVRWSQPRVHQSHTHVQVGHGSGFDRGRELTGAEVHHPDHEQRQQQLLKHQQGQEHHRHQHPHNPQQHNPGGDEDQESRTQYLLHTPQSDSASPPVSVTQAPETGENPTSFTPAIQKDSATSQTYADVTHPKQTATKGEGRKVGTEREESGSALSGDSARPETPIHRKESDSSLSGRGDNLTEEELRQKLLVMVQSEPERDSLLHPHQSPKPTMFKSAISTVAPRSTAARQLPFRPASPRRRRRKHRKRISKAAMRAMIM